MLNVALNWNHRAGHYQQTTTSNKISQHAYNGYSQAKCTYDLFRQMWHEPSFVWVDRIKGERPRRAQLILFHTYICVTQILLKIKNNYRRVKF